MFEVNEARSYQRRWWILLILTLGLLLISLDNTIINVALPTLARELSASGSQLQWIVDAYILVFAGLLLSLGSVDDRYGRKLGFLIGLVIFGTGSLVAALSGEANWLIVGQAIMGIGGAFILPATLSIITNIFPQEERSRAIAIWTGVFGSGIVIGPLTGGWLLDNFAWGAIFYINLPVAIVTFGLAFFFMPESKDPNATPLDIPGAILSILAITALLYAIIEVPTYGWGDAGILVALGATVVFLAAFIWWERRIATPMLDISLFKNKRFSAASLSIALVSFAMFGTIFFLTQYLQLILGFDALAAGIRIMPIAGGLILGAALSTRLINWLGLKFSVAIGLGLVAGGLLLMSTVTAQSDYELIVICLLILSFGIGIAQVPATNSIMNALPLEKAGVGSATNDTTREVGGALGVAILGSVLSAVYHSQMEGVGAGLTPPLVSALRDSLSKAIAVSQQVGGETGKALLTAAQSAFITAMSQTVLVAAGVALFGALLSLFFLPRQLHPDSVNTASKSETLKV